MKLAELREDYAERRGRHMQVGDNYAPGRTDVGWERFRVEHYIREYGYTKTVAAIQAAFDNDQLGEEEAQRIIDWINETNPQFKTYSLR